MKIPNKPEGHKKAFPELLYYQNERCGK